MLRPSRKRSLRNAGQVARVLWLAALTQTSGCSDEVEVLAASNRSSLPDAAQAGDASKDAGKVVGDAARPADAGQAPPLEPVLLYRFDEGAGKRVLDSSTDGALVHLTIEDPERVTWLDGALRIDAPTRIINEAAPFAATGVVADPDAASIEAWIRPSETALAGPHPIVGLTVFDKDRDLLLEQGSTDSANAEAAFMMRVRTDRNEPFALSTGAGSAKLALTHVVMVSRADETACAYIDGVEVRCSEPTGTFGNWTMRTILSLGNRPDDDAVPKLGWTGELHWVAVYAQALTAREVEQLFKLGPTRGPSGVVF